MTRQASSRLSRRTILKTAAAGAAVLDFPLPLRAQAPVLKIGVVHPVTGPARGARAGAPAGRDDGSAAARGRGLRRRAAELMLDEPSLGLAPVVVKQIFENLARINREGTTILLVEQNVGRALGLAHRAYVLESGRVALSGTSESLLASAHVKQAYLGI